MVSHFCHLAVAEKVWCGGLAQKHNYGISLEC